MAIAFRAAGAETAGVTDPSAAIALPTGWQPGDLHILMVNIKINTTYVFVPTGWTAFMSNNFGGTGTLGADAGANRVLCFFRIAQTGDTSVTLDFSAAPNAYQARIVGFSKAAGEEWELPVFSAVAADTSGVATSYGAVTGNMPIPLAAGDWIGQYTGFNGDAGTPGSRTFSVPGVTLGTYAAHVADVPTTVGGQLRHDFGTAPYASGAATGAPTLSRVWTGGSASFSGATVFFRLRVYVPSSTAIRYIDGASVSYDTVTSTTFAIPRPQASGRPLTQGDFLFAHISYATASTTPPSRTLPAGWVSLVPLTLIGTSTTTVAAEAIYYVVTAADAASPPASWNITITTGFEGSISVARYINVDTTTPIAVASPGYAKTDTSTAALTKPAPAVTTTSTNTMVLSGATTRSGTAFLQDVTDNYYVAVNSFSIGGRASGIAQIPQAAAGASGTITWTHTTTGIGLAYQTALRQGAAAPQPTYNKTQFLSFF